MVFQSGFLNRISLNHRDIHLSSIAGKKARRSGIHQDESIHQEESILKSSIFYGKNEIEMVHPWIFLFWSDNQNSLNYYCIKDIFHDNFK